MFVDYSINLDLPERLVAELLMSHAAEMEGMGAAAYRRGEGLRSKVGPPGPLAKEVVIALDKPFMSRHGAVVPVRWRATGTPALFPRLDGELSVEGRTGGGCALQLKATYQPPLGSVGGLMDRIALARVARATVADWVDRIAEWLTATAGDSSDREDDLYDRSGADN